MSASTFGLCQKFKGFLSHTQTLKLRFLYVTDSTLNPIVGIVVTTSPI